MVWNLWCLNKYIFDAIFAVQVTQLQSYLTANSLRRNDVNETDISDCLIELRLMRVLVYRFEYMYCWSDLIFLRNCLLEKFIIMLPWWTTQLFIHLLNIFSMLRYYVCCGLLPNYYFKHLIVSILKKIPSLRLQSTSTGKFFLVTIVTYNFVTNVWAKSSWFFL